MPDTALHVNTATMGLNDAVNHRKPQTGSLFDILGCKEWHKNLL